MCPQSGILTCVKLIHPPNRTQGSELQVSSFVLQGSTVTACQNKHYVGTASSGFPTSFLPLSSIRGHEDSIYAKGGGAVLRPFCFDQYLPVYGFSYSLGQYAFGIEHVRYSRVRL